MSFKTWSEATSFGHQFSRSSILNSKVSKKIHDQNRTAFCWAFAISTMLRNSLLIFLESILLHQQIKANAIFNLKTNEFHKRLRQEIIMMPIPKPSIIADKMVGHQCQEDFIEKIIQKQSHNLELAMFRVCCDLN